MRLANILKLSKTNPVLSAFFTTTLICSTLSASNAASDASARSESAAKGSSKKQFFQTPESNLEVNKSANVNSKFQSIHLKSGEIITNSSKQLEIEAPNAKITICPGSVVIISASDKLTRILGCWETSQSCIHVQTPAGSRTVPLGKELSVITETDTDEAEKLLAATNLRRRLVHYEKPKDGIMIVDAQFSLLDVILKDSILHPMSDTNADEGKSIIARINKAAAALTLAGSKEPYNLIDQ